MLLSICIPSYNRPLELRRLLKSLKDQKGNFEIVIAEDFSPKRREIENVVLEFKEENPQLDISLSLNVENLGYDGNLRNLISLSKGSHCLFMGDDDIMNVGGIEKVCSVLCNYPEIGFILRSWKEVDLEGNTQVIQRYYNRDIYFEKGVDTVIEFYRKSVFISGLVIKKDIALKYASPIADGKLLYQLYLLSNILLDNPGFYIHDIITTRISGAEHFFGSSKAEKGKFEPKTLTIEHSVNFMKGFIDIVDIIERERVISFRDEILKDLSKYSYGFLSVQRGNGILNFLSYVRKLRLSEFAQTYHFYVYTGMLALLGEHYSNKVVGCIKKNIKNIPKL